MFGTPNTHLADILPEDAAYQGDQIRGFGFRHDGSVATLFDFFRARFFDLEDEQRLRLEDYMLAFDTTFAPIVGQQIPLNRDNVDVVGPRIDLMIARAATRFDLLDQPEARECDLVAKAVSGGQLRGYRLDVASGDFQTDRDGEPQLTDAELRSLATIDGQPITYTCAPRAKACGSEWIATRTASSTRTKPTHPLPRRHQPRLLRQRRHQRRLRHRCRVSAIATTTGALPLPRSSPQSTSPSAINPSPTVQPRPRRGRSCRRQRSRPGRR
jgi:hypothetical protein